MMALKIFIYTFCFLNLTTQTLQIRGKPGIDYPIYSEIPQTSFRCSDHGLGIFADPETHCQVFHQCYEHRQESFLCPPGTIFNQPIKACDYWYSAQCDSALFRPAFEAKSPVNNVKQIPESPIHSVNERSDALFDKIASLYDMDSGTFERPVTQSGIGDLGWHERRSDLIEDNDSFDPSSDVNADFDQQEAGSHALLSETGKDIENDSYDERFSNFAIDSSEITPAEEELVFLPESPIYRKFEDDEFEYLETSPEPLHKRVSSKRNGHVKKRLPPKPIYTTEPDIEVVTLPPKRRRERLHEDIGDEGKLDLLSQSEFTSMQNHDSSGIVTLVKEADDDFSKTIISTGIEGFEPSSDLAGEKHKHRFKSAVAPVFEREYTEEKGKEHETYSDQDTVVQNKLDGTDLEKATTENIGSNANDKIKNFEISAVQQKFNPIGEDNVFKSYDSRYEWMPSDSSTSLDGQEHLDSGDISKSRSQIALNEDQSHEMDAKYSYEEQPFENVWRNTLAIIPKDLDVLENQDASESIDQAAFDNKLNSDMDSKYYVDELPLEGSILQNSSEFETEALDQFQTYDVPESMDRILLDELTTHLGEKYSAEKEPIVGSVFKKPEIVAHDPNEIQINDDPQKSTDITTNIWESKYILPEEKTKTRFVVKEVDVPSEQLYDGDTPQIILKSESNASKEKLSQPVSEQDSFEMQLSQQELPTKIIDGSPFSESGTIFIESETKPLNASLSNESLPFVELDSSKIKANTSVIQDFATKIDSTIADTSLKEVNLSVSDHIAMNWLRRELPENPVRPSNLNVDKTSKTHPFPVRNTFNKNRDFQGFSAKLSPELSGQTGTRPPSNGPSSSRANYLDTVNFPELTRHLFSPLQRFSGISSMENVLYSKPDEKFSSSRWSKFKRLAKNFLSSKKATFDIFRAYYT